ncbi:mannose-6-phosphate isomerase, class I [Acidipropionibacterium timonense]|uniref:mannose-6-phosphate isomerase, class I n=1 Tax=Acidipropionibacterium timonense TaxID=2161818 RepID=UPI001030179D|nr:mannose-6-phosphate isomerase, class I [Acidipropionibacterium timonense]
MERLAGSIRTYSWGSLDAIPAILGTEPTGDPQAEYWLGAHPLAPSTLADGTSLGARIDARPEELGAGSRQTFGDRLPFLLKILAAERPLSLQAHPDADAAAAGFEAENRRGLALDDPIRTFRDGWPKPELFVALGDVDVLCGFRDPLVSRSLFDALDLRVSLDAVLGPLTERHGSAGLAEVFLDCLTGGAERQAWVEEVVSAAVNHVSEPGEFGDFARTAVELDEQHPGDPSIMAALLLNRIRLRAGDGLRVSPGVLHAYLHGTGVEIMANSDNVVRGGITDKHIDVESLVSIVTFDTEPPTILHPIDEGAGLWRYPTPDAQYRLWRLDLSVAAPAMLPSSDLARILLVTGGYAVCSGSAGTEEIVHGQAVWIPAGEQVQVHGNCDGFLATAGLG